MVSKEREERCCGSVLKNVWYVFNYAAHPRCNVVPRWMKGFRCPSRTDGAVCRLSGFAAASIQQTMTPWFAARRATDIKRSVKQTADSPEARGEAPSSVFGRPEHSV